MQAELRIALGQSYQASLAIRIHTVIAHSGYESTYLANAGVSYFFIKAEYV